MSDMQYPWEKKINRGDLTEAMEGLQDFLPKKLRVVGVVVAHMDNVEGAFIPHKDFKPDGIIEADIALDAMGDLDAFRIEAITKAGLRPETAVPDVDPLGR
jgi:hypothetical protein